MADRYEDSDRGRRAGERREEHDRADWGREDPYNRGRAERGNWEESYRAEERFGGNQWDRERRPSGSGEPGGRSDFGNRGNYPDSGEFRGRGWEGERALPRSRREWPPERSGNEGPFGTGSQGYGTGYRSSEFSSAGGAYGNSGDYTGYGAGGAESYSGGAGMRSQYGQQQGRFSGRGPKGYQRSDERIREDVCERLTHHPEIDAVEIEVNVKEGEVTLTGTVDDRQSKRMAEDVAEGVSGVKDVRNHVQVRQPQMAASHQGRLESGTERSGSEKTGSQKR